MNKKESSQELAALIQTCSNFLTEAAGNPQHPWRLAVLANVDVNGDPECRYVVLRDCQFKDKAELCFFTDQRSKKVFAIGRQTRVSLCFFDPLARLQLSVKATATMHNQDEVSLHYWGLTSWHSLRCFYMNETPGEPLAAPFLLRSEELSEEQAYRYFTVVRCQVHSWDILRLREEGNQRACCVFDQAGRVKASNWLVP